MGTNTQFKIQNGASITGEVVVGGQLVITADGQLVIPSSTVAVSDIVIADISALQAQLDAVLGSSPAHLDTLQEIVTLFQSEDGDLSSLVATNSSAIAAFQTAIDLKLDDSDFTVLETSVTEVLGLVSGTGVAPTLSTNATSIISAINELNTSLSSLSGGICINYDASTGVISVDEADAAANLHVATSSDTNSLDGQDGDYYRLDVYDANDTIIN